MVKPDKILTPSREFIPESMAANKRVSISVASHFFPGSKVVLKLTVIL